MITKTISNKQRLTYGSRRMNIMFVLMSVLLITSLSQSVQPIEISLQHGHNSYTPLNKYFRSTQYFTISDMNSQLDLKSYHFCYVEISTYSQIQKVDTLSITNNSSFSSTSSNKDINTNNKFNTHNKDINKKNTSKQQYKEKIICNLDDIISTENVLATKFYQFEKQSKQQSVVLVFIVMPNKYITLRLQQQVKKQTQQQKQQTNYPTQQNQRRYKIVSKLSTSFGNTISIAKFIDINNINNDNNKNNTQGIVGNKEELILMTDRQVFKIQIDNDRLDDQNYWGSIYIYGNLNAVNTQIQSIERNLQQLIQQPQLQQQTPVQQKNQPQTDQINQSQQQQQQQQLQQQNLQVNKIQVEQQIKQQQQQPEQQQQQHFTQGVAINNNKILLYSNKHIYLYDVINGKLNRINQSNNINSNNNNLYHQLIGRKNIDLQIIQYSNSKNNKDKVNNNNSENNQENLNKVNQQSSSFVLLVADKGNDIKLTYYSNQNQLLTHFSLQSQSHSTQQKSLTQQQKYFYSLPNTHKCRAIHSFNNQIIFLQCKNHLLYYSLQDIFNCNKYNTFQYTQINTQQCLNTITPTHLNLGYHIQSIYFNQQQTNYLTVTGIDKYQIFYIDYCCMSHHINSIKNVATYYFNQQNIKQVFMIDYNNSLLLTKTNVIVVKQLQQTKQIYCKTVDQHSHKGLSQPTGIFNGNLTIEGRCKDSLFNTNNNNDGIDGIMYEKISNSTYCKYNIPITVNINYVVKTYQFLWYILLGVGLFLIIIGVLYCLIKRQKLNQIYKTLEQEKQHGQQVVQNTVITQTNQSQQQAIGIDALK